MFGCGAVAQSVLSGGTHGRFLSVNFAFGFAAMLGILICGQVSGKQTHHTPTLLANCNHFNCLFLDNDHIIIVKFYII